MPDTPTKPIVIFDGDCSFCRFWVNRWQCLVGDTIDFKPSADAAPAHPEIPPERFAQSVVFIDDREEAFYGAHAVFRLLATDPRRRCLLTAFEIIPGIRATTELAYRFIAHHRNFAAIANRLLYGRNPEPPDCRLVRWTFLRALALIYLIAFASLWVQIDGLIGSHGIIPASDYLAAVARYLGASAYFQMPTLAWFSSSDLVLNLFCGLGCLLSLVAFAGVIEGPAFLGSWVLYLSLVQAGQEFLGFQWDNLLLEAGLLACFFAVWSWRSRPTSDVPHRRAVVWLVRILVCKLMFMSGIAKLASGDPNWRNLTALDFHYWTQPLPTWVGWYAAQLPEWMHRLSTLLMFITEVGLPFLIFTPRRPRQLAFWGLVTLQIVILLTGNYGFFNYLSIVLCIALLDDHSLRAILRLKPKRSAIPLAQRRKPMRIKHAVIVAYGVIFIALSVNQTISGFGSRGRPIPFLGSIERLLSPLRSINRYGLFSVMTTRRPEITVEGSNDGENWHAYKFKWKPGALTKRPAFVAPHMPRLDWQMWFAALGNPHQNRWFAAFIQRLLEGEKPVLDLLAADPFPDRPPRYIRATLNEYTPADARTHATTGKWWTSRLSGTYVPPSSLTRDQ